MTKAYNNEIVLFCSGNGNVEPNYEMAEAHLTLLDETAYSFTFQLFHETDRSKPGYVLNGSIEEHWSDIKSKNIKGYGAFVTVNKTDGTGRKKGNIIHIRAVWQEDDGEGKPTPKEPHFTVESSPGKFHRYFLTDNNNVEEFEAVQQRLVDDYGSDPNAKDRTRVLRLAGTLHQKNPDTPHLVRIVSQSNEQPTPWGEIKRAFPPVEKVPLENFQPSDLDISELVKDVITGENFHGSLLSLSASFIAKGMRPGDVTSMLQGLMKAHRGKDDRWQVRYDDIERQVKTAVEKFAHEQKKSGKLPQGITEVPWVTLLNAADIKPEPIRWLWTDYLAKGKLHIIAGPAGTGKTTIAMQITASISANLNFPDGNKAPVGKVIIWSGEDDPQDTLVPRILANGGNPKNIYFVGDVITGEEIQSFDPSRHIPLLEAAIEKIGEVSLIVIDPIVNAVSGDSHKNTEVRRALQPVVDLAVKHDAAVIGITHFSKGTTGQNPVERVTGSIAFGALARVVFAAVKIQSSDGEEKRLFTRAKSNIGPDGGGFYYAIQQMELFEHPGLTASYIKWLEPVEGDARTLLADAEVSSDNEERGALSEVQEWLRDLLTDEGSMEKKEIMKLAKENNFAVRTVQRAREKLKVRHRMEGFGKSKKSIWSLPESDKTICANDLPEKQNEKVGTYDRTHANKGIEGNHNIIRAKQPCTENLGMNGTNGRSNKIVGEI